MNPRSELGRHLSFALYAAANRMIRRHRPLLEPLGLTFPQYLVTLALLDDAPLTVGALGARLGVDAGTITPLVKRLEAADMVSRERDRADERRVLVDLSSPGRALEREVRSVTEKIRTACHLTHGDVDDLRRALEGLAHPAADVTATNQRRRTP